MDNNYCVYKHTCPNGKVYIGITGRKPETRWQSGHGYRSNRHFWNAIQKYGWENISHDILLSGLSKEAAGEYEKMYIYFFNSADKEHGYNKTHGGEIGGKPTEETILKISGKNHYMAKRIEQYSLSGDYINTFGCVMDAAKELGENYSSIAACARHEHYTAFGYIWVYEDDLCKEKWILDCAVDRSKGGNHPSSKRIIQYDLNGNLIKTFSCLTEASEKTGTQISKISNCANGVRFSANGFIWLFEDDKNKEQSLQKKVTEKKHPSAMCGSSNHQARPIEQYSLDGKYIATYGSAQEAADDLGIDYSTIKSCASGRNHSKSAGGFIWIHSDELDKAKALEKRIDKGCERAVSQYSLNGEYIRDFCSITDANIFFSGKRTGHISSVCAGKRKSAYGYIWRYAEGRTV